MDELGNVVVIECEVSARATTYSDVKHPFPNFLNKSSGGRAKYSTQLIVIISYDNIIIMM